MAGVRIVFLYFPTFGDVNPSENHNPLGWGIRALTVAGIQDEPSRKGSSAAWAYSDLNEWTGFEVAALTACQLMARKVTVKTTAPEPAKIHQDRGIR